MRDHAAAKNASWLILGRLLRMGIQLAVGVLTARYLGPADYGLLSYASAYTGFFSAFCTLGIDSILVRELTDTPEKSGEILGTALLLRGISSLLSAVTILCVVFVADRRDPAVLAVVGFSCLGMVCQTFDFFHFWFQSRLQSRVTAVVSLIAYLAAAGYRLYLLTVGRQVAWFAAATMLEQLLTAALLLTVYRRCQGAGLRISRERGRSLLQKSCHFILPGLMVAVYAQTDKIMLGHMTSEAELGYYSTAVSVSSAWCFVLTAVIESVYPGITKAYKQDPAAFDRRNRQLYAFVFYFSGAVSLLLCWTAKPLIALLYGDSYRRAEDVLRILTWLTGFSYLGVARNAWIVCKEKQKYLIWAYMAAAMTNVALNALLVPKWGASGAAAASLAAQVATTMVAPFLIPQLRENGKLMLDAIALRGIFTKKNGG